MKIEIDQSGKIEQTQWPTVIGVSNGKSYSLLISANEKKKLQGYFRKRNKGKIYVLRVFAGLIYIAVTKFASEVDSVTIDLEYYGRDKTIHSMIKEIATNCRMKLPAIHFARIGNRPRAHYTALDVFAKRKKPTVRVTAQEIIDLLAPNKKDRGRND